MKEGEGITELAWSVLEQLAIDLRSISPSIRADAWHTANDPTGYPMELIAGWAGVSWPEVREVYGSEADLIG